MSIQLFPKVYCFSCKGSRHSCLCCSQGGKAQTAANTSAKAARLNAAASGDEMDFKESVKEMNIRNIFHNAPIRCFHSLGRRSYDLSKLPLYGCLYGSDGVEVHGLPRDFMWRSKLVFLLSTTLTLEARCFLVNFIVVISAQCLQRVSERSLMIA
eukprot:scaffold1524_cov140-Skeletonema_menzelii.AAC.3